MSLEKPLFRVLRRSIPVARIEAMASRFSFGERGSGSRRSSASREAVGTAPGLNSAFHIVTSGWSGPDGPVWMPWDSPGGVGRVRRHPRPPQLPLPVRRLVSDAVAGYRPRPCRLLPTGGLSKLSDEGSNSRVFTTEHRACSRNPRKRLFGLNSVISNGLTQLDDFRTRSGKNGEYGPNREGEAEKEGGIDRWRMALE